LVFLGETINEPLTGTLPIPGLIEAVMAPVELQVSIEELPEKIVAGEAVILIVGLAAQISKTNPPNAIADIISMEIFLLIFILHT